MTLARKRERAWRVTRKLGSLVILAESERECLENHERALERVRRKVGCTAGCCIGPY